MIDTNNIYTLTFLDNFTIKVIKMSKAHNNNWMCTLMHNDDVLMINAITKKSTKIETPNEKLFATLLRQNYEMEIAVNVLSSLKRDGMMSRLREFGFTKV